ncbi:histidine kinase [Roseovarius spongiae]|uniref:Histidine kinase n=1 Tax=Roseovarius spongiae TaxID=2320272 RepID=A0A3A8AWM1_9RHOB|nr:DUF6446 family protein [Roseovarius spongiae]RKF16046.1 histidine kinase [Roseovarius spongiae]
MGKILTFLILACALVAGGVMYYLQVYYYYEEVQPDGVDDVMLTPLVTGEPEAIAYEDFRAIDAESSPIRYRACFTTPQSPAALADVYQPAKDAVPLVAPGWFSCFDAAEIGAALEAGRARAFLGAENIHYGIDRIVAVHEDGRGWAWQQINHCGEIVFDGAPAPPECPPPPD